MTQEARTIARTVAKRLAAAHGPDLPAEVELAIAAGGQPVDRDRYADPVAIGQLVVAAATLGWTVYLGLRRDNPKPTSDLVRRTIRARLHEQLDVDGGVRERVVDVVIEETTHAAGLDAPE
ncbi:hypothetical protein AB0J90_27095 [Micromonospora sp. NPDC049523]|uniref:hypothetical protein n=1 Tax=Micromonospora sp. NPDC049523 TaxID=3155921 RepID=UPI00343CD27A